MRGPGIKLDLDVRRLWTCPVCHKQRRLPGHIASPLCPCRDEGVIMQLTADSKLLRRAERITPLPFEKTPGAVKPIIPDPASEAPEPQPTSGPVVVADAIKEPEAPARDEFSPLSLGGRGAGGEGEFTEAEHATMATDPVSAPSSGRSGHLLPPGEKEEVAPSPQPPNPPDVDDFADGL